MNRHDLKLVCVSIAATLVCTLSVNTVLADTPLRDSIKSYGVFKYDNDPSDNQDDIVIDSSDLVTLANEIDTAKNSIGVVGKNLDKLVTVFDKMDEEGKDGKLYGTQIDSTDAGILKIENAFANGVGDATASKVLKDYTFTSQYGLNIPGTIESLQTSTITPGTKNQTLKAGFYLEGAQTIKGDANLKSENILSGKSIFGVSGSVIAEVNSSAHTVPSGKTIAAAANILKDTTAWNGTIWVDGSMTNKSNTTTAASTVTEDGSNAKIQIPESGYYDANNSYITVPVETLKKEVSALNSSLDEAMKDVTSISIDSYATASDTYTILTNGVYDVCVSPKHHGDSCPGGTGRYGANLLINGDTVDSYSGNASAKRNLKCTRYLTAGSVISVQVRDWCSNCDYKHNSNTATLKIDKWTFITS